MDDTRASASCVNSYTLSVGTPARGRYLYLTGGHFSEDSGCPPWGTSNPADIRFIGDTLGYLTVAYGDGSTASVPLVLGWTLWLHSVWNESPAPFFGPDTDPALTDALRSSLSVFGAFDHAPEWTLRVSLADKEVVSVTISGVDGHNGHPVFTSARVSDAESLPVEGAQTAAFFAAHPVVLGEEVPAAVRSALETICRALHTFDSDFADAPSDFDFPADGLPYKVRFFGGELSGIATASVWVNMKNLVDRTEDGGMLHTSYKDAPSWRYDGFGPYVMRANSYYDAFYSRDAGRAIMTLNAYGHKDKAKAAALYGDDWMMTYPREGKTLGGVPIPGHFSVMPNKPYIYSQVLSKIGVPALCDDAEGSTASAWPTRYTKKRFGDEYENLGNQETDGHGLMMLANYLTWVNRGSSADEALENWTYINEAAEWIVWCFDHPELSFVENDLLYGETEAAMNAYTLYANIPCQLGLTCYADIADAVGKQAEAAKWRAYADRLRGGIDRGLTDGSGWLYKKHGFFHDPVVTFLSDVYGFDTADMPADWVARSRASYRYDLENTVRFGWYGAPGIGYDHCMITQNALLLDQTADADRLLSSLCKLCWSPRLPEPFLVPEGLCVDTKRGILRRQGDLANLVQLAEAMKCWRLAVGLSPMRNGMIKIMPRLPHGWGVELTDFPVQNTAMTADMTLSPVNGSSQTISVSFKGDKPSGTVAVRFGPFPVECRSASVTLNGVEYTVPTVPSGDAAWGWVSTIL
ncbi:MAG: hypothetical protein MJ192_05155 [Clostridia bacterium]|nr:hypothetical protein [Clostridia bacterium]